MTQQLVPHGNWLIQVSWGEMKIWSSETYQLLNSVRIFDRVVTSLALVGGIVVCCGRDATQESDSCGLDPGLKGWRFVLGDRKDSEDPKDDGEVEANQQMGTDSGVFHIGPPVRTARGLAVLKDSRLVVCVLRGVVWSVEIWEI
jgi:hypothetical protein